MENALTLHNPKWLRQLTLRQPRFVRNLPGPDGLCSHVMPGTQANAAEQVDAALQAAISSERKAK
ncbi:MAG: hypothetical protein E5X48_13715 [Mesorhizobium sp.]|uniref:hypothetical protein n=1 Tax=Mesorhizobium sp. TaxID=1871066 RepID=UPI0011F8C612|nr:hypothetical protein [Mesorhizobium sp.]TIQ35422.1 MAG: hypothetical protein E5X48_13715 [Mesorhizobium sp.]